MVWNLKLTLMPKDNFELINSTCAVMLIIQKFVTNVTSTFVASVSVVTCLMTGRGGVVGDIGAAAVVVVNGDVSVCVVVAGVNNGVTFISV